MQTPVRDARKTTRVWGNIIFRTLVKSRRIQVHATWWTLLTYTLNRILDLKGKQYSHLEMPTFVAHVRQRWRRSRRRLFKPHGTAIMGQFEWSVLQKASPPLTGALWFDVTLFAEEWAVYVRNLPPYLNQIQIYHSWERVVQDVSEPWLVCEWKKDMDLMGTWLGFKFYTRMSMHCHR